MKTMKKIVAIMAAALMLCSILPLSVMAADGYIKADSISIGDTVVLVCESKSMELNGISTTSTKYGLGVAYTDAPAGAYPLEVVAGSTSGTYAFKTSDDNYLCWTSGNSLNVAATLSDNTSWTVTFETGNAVILNANDSSRKLQWNASSPRFACYTSAQTAIQLYKLSGADDDDCEHANAEYENGQCQPGSCPDCGATLPSTEEHDYELLEAVDAACGVAGSESYECARCGENKTEVIPALSHKFADGRCELCGIAQPSEATITFDNKVKRTDYSTTIQVWEENGITVTNNKGNSTNDVGDYANPVRLYAKSSVTIAYPGMTKIDFLCNGSSYVTALKNSLSASANIAINDNTVTLTLDSAVDSYTIAELTAQVQLKSITVYAESQSGGDESECDHEYDDCFDSDCNKCGETREITPEDIVDAAYGLTSGASLSSACTLTGVITSIKTAYDSNYGNVSVIIDVIGSNGEAIADKPILCYRLAGEGADVISLDYTITVTGTLTNYNGTIEFAQGCQLISYEAGAFVCPGHEYTSNYDATCNICYEEREVSLPAADSELTFDEAAELGLGLDSQVYTKDKYYLVGKITEVYNEQYGNMYIEDAEGNIFTIYGSYSADGSTGYQNMDVKPVGDDTIKVYGIIGNYNGSAQMKNGWIIEINAGGCEHEYEYECSTTCDICGEGVRDVACVNNNDACQDGLCIYCGNDVDGLGHAYDSDYDADCNYCGEERDVPDAPTEATITFDADKTQRTEYSTTTQKWESGALILINNKGGSTNDVGDYSNPGRFYKSSEIIISFPGMTSLVIDAPSGQYGTPWADTLDAAGYTYTVEEGIYTVTFAEPVDSITLTCSSQIRANSITAVATKSSEPEKPVDIVYGDADGDGEVTLLDASLLQQYLTGWDVTLDEAAADADGDGEVTLLDASLLQQYLTGWDVTLGA